METNQERKLREEIYKNPKTKTLGYSALFLRNKILKKWMANENIRAETLGVLKAIIQRKDILKNVRNRIRLVARDYLKNIDLAEKSREFEQLVVPEQSDVPPAFCIRTGTRIQFNLKKPYCDKGWAERKSVTNWDENAKENYCHFSGDSSNLKNKVSYKQPVMKKHWKKASENNNI